MEAVNKQNRGFEDGKNGACDDMKSLEEEASALRLKIKKLELCLEERLEKQAMQKPIQLLLKSNQKTLVLKMIPYLRITRISALNCKHWIRDCHLIPKKIHKESRFTYLPSLRSYVVIFF